MKALVFHIGADRYALPLEVVARVLPAAALKSVPLAPHWVAGLLDLHGTPLPVIDVSRLAGLAPRQVWVDTRIVLVDYPLPDGSRRHLGLLAEHVTGIDTIDTAALSAPGVAGAPFLGRCVGASTSGTSASTSSAGSAGMLQLIELDQLLSAEVRALLFPAVDCAATGSSVEPGAACLPARDAPA